jgi:hypothetical protein
VKPSVKLGIALGVCIVLVGLAVVSAMGFVLLTAPRMRIQPSIRTYQTAVPPLPAGVIPVEQPVVALPSEEDALTWTNPVTATPENSARGKVYYQYYCIFCHGEQGRGDGPVGQSYVPIPADLSAQKIQAYSDGQLLRAMLSGIGHEPVLERVVPPEHRGYLVHYVRSLLSPAPEAPDTPSSWAGTGS